MKTRKAIILIVFLFLTLGYWIIAHKIERNEHLFLFGIYILLVVCSILFYFIVKKLRHGLSIIFLTGIVFRLTFLLVQPSLSDDFFRFIWDGELNKDGVSPFSFLPKEHDQYFSQNKALKKKYSKLYKAKTDSFPKGMNSTGYYSIYPAVNQTVFWIASYTTPFNNSHLIVMRLFLLLAEIISFFVLKRLLISQQSSANLTAIYWLNPLVIIEIVGNLHFEGIAITFILLTLLFIRKNQAAKAGITAALAILTKLNPLFLLGATFSYFNGKKQIIFSGVAIVGTIIFMSFYMNFEEFLNFKKSFGLYFAWFSFNSGIMSFLKFTIYKLTGYNVISILSLVFPFITMILLGYVAFLQKRIPVPEKLLLFFMIYFCLSPIVHPWYITVMLPLGILSKKAYPLVWSILIFFTYSAYKVDGFEQNYGIVWGIYALVISLFIWESKKKRHLFIFK